jgi:hypothetical protein
LADTEPASLAQFARLPVVVAVASAADSWSASDFHSGPQTLISVGTTALQAEGSVAGAARDAAECTSTFSGLVQRADAGCRSDVVRISIEAGPSSLPRAVFVNALQAAASFW